MNITRLRIISIFLFLFVIFCTYANNIQGYTWDKKNKFNGWGNPYNLTLTNDNDFLLLKIEKKDSSIAIRNLSIDPTILNYIEVEYCANGIPVPNSGQIFFANKNQDRFVGNQYWRFFNIKNDGKWHTLKLIASNRHLAYGIDSWQKCGIIDKLRLDMIDQTEGSIKIRAIRISSKKSISLFDKLNKWPNVEVQLPKAKAEKANLSTPYYSGYIIKSTYDNVKNIVNKDNKFAFRRKFVAPENIQKALIQIMADDGYELFLNGKKILSSNEVDGWKTPQKMDVSNLLNLGEENLISGSYFNNGGAGGLLLELSMLLLDNKCENIPSDENFVSTLYENKLNYHQLNYDDSNWQNMILQSPPPALPWGVKIPFQCIKNPPNINILDVKLPPKAIADTNVEINVTGQGSQIKSVDNFLLQLQAQDSTLISETNYKLKPDDIKYINNDLENWQMNFKFHLPKFFSSQKMKINVILSNKNHEEIFEYKAINLLEKETSAKVVINKNNHPVLQLNDKKLYPLIGNSPDIRFAESNYDKVPMDLRTIWFRDNNFYVAENDYRFGVLDKSFEQLLSSDPNTPIILFIGIDMPLWWGKIHWQELMRFNDNSSWGYGLAPVSFASEKYLKEARKLIDKIITHCQTAPYRKKIAGYVLCAGYSAEWQNWACHATARLNKLSDYSGNFKNKFSDFYKSKYALSKDKNTTVPTFEERIGNNSKNNIFINNDKNMQKNIALNDFLSISMVKFLRENVNYTRNLIGDNKLLGVYYGYTFEYTNLSWALQMSGHNALAEVLKIKSLDFLLSPPSYGIRAIGDSGEDMKPFASISVAKKLSIIDDDTRTHTTKFVDFFQTLNKEQTRNVLRRNFGRTLCRLEPLCLYSLVGANEFSSKETTEDLKLFKKLNAYAINNNVYSNSEIAVVVSEKSHNVMAMNKEATSQGIRQWYGESGQVNQAPRRIFNNVGESVYYQRSRLARTGASYDFILAEDIQNVIDRPYKLWIFLNAYNIDQKFIDNIKKLTQRKTTLLWLRTPGMFFENKLNNLSVAKQLVGIDFSIIQKEIEPIIRFNNGKYYGNYKTTYPLFSVKKNDKVKDLGRYYGMPNLIGAASTKYNNATSIFYGVDFLDSKVMRDIAKQSGVHIFSETDDIIYTNSNFILFHASKAGNKEIKLPKTNDVVDIFNKKIVAKKTKSFTFNSKIHETYLFFIGDANKIIKEL